MPISVHADETAGGSRRGARRTGQLSAVTIIGNGNCRQYQGQGQKADLVGILVACCHQKPGVKILAEDTGYQMIPVQSCDAPSRRIVTKSSA